MAGSLLLASSFRASDYLIPFGAAFSPGGSEQLSEQLYPDSKGFALGAAQPSSKFRLRVNCAPPRPGKQQISPDAECLSLHSARTTSLTEEVRSPSHRHRRGQAAAAAAAAWPAACVSDDSAAGSAAPSREPSELCKDFGADVALFGAASCCTSPLQGSTHSSPSSRSGTGGGGVGSGTNGSHGGSPPEAKPPGQTLRTVAGQQDAQDTASQQDFVTPQARLLMGNSRGSSSGGRTLTPGSRGASLQQQLELLEAKLAAECEARSALQRHLREQRRGAERERQALGWQYEGQLAALRREVQQAADVAGADGLSGSILSGSLQLLTLSTQEQEAVRRQLSDQELLIKAYQAENELAVIRIRQQHAEQQRQAAEAQQQVEELQQQLALAHAERERQPPTTPSVDGARLQELLRLQADLEAVQAAAGQRERELRQQVDYLSRNGQEVKQRLQAGSMLLQQTQQQLADSDGLVQQQARVISQLEQQLLLQEGSDSYGMGASGGSSQAMQQLEVENASLRQALHHQHAQLMQQQATDPAGHWSSNENGEGTRDGVLLAEHQGKLGRLQAALQLKEEQHQRQLRAMRAEHERQRVEQGIRAASKGGVARVKEVEAQLEEVQEAAAKKLRIMESRLKEAEVRGRRAQGVTRPATASNAGSLPGPRPAGPPLGAGAARPQARPAGKAAAAQHEALLAATTQLQQKEQRIRRLESELTRKDAELAALHKRADTADQQLNAAAEQQQASSAVVASLQQAVAEVTAANDSLQAQLKEAAATRHQLVSQQQVVQQQAERLEAAEAAVASLQQAQAEAAQQAAAGEAQHVAEQQLAQQEQARLLGLAQQAEREAVAAEWRPRVKQLEQQAADWRRQVGQLEQDLRSARAGLPWTPSAAEFAALEWRMVECEQRAQQREAHWQGVAEQGRRAMAVQQERMRQRFEGALEAKGQQVDGFQQQLDGLLSAARLLQAAGAGGG